MKGLVAVVTRSVVAGIAIWAAFHALPALFDGWGSDQPVQWWAARSSGFVAQFTITMSMLFGLMISSRGLDGGLHRSTVLELHQQWSLAAVIALAAHVLIIVTDSYSSITVTGALTPGLSEELTGPVALGAIAFWGILLLTLSSWLRAYLSFVVWRVIHTVATAAFVLGIVHGMTAGTDTNTLVFEALYVASGSAVIGATIFRFLYVARRRTAPASVAPRA
jgi:sulfoxide reductase heme-binding subunit YedZ